MALKTSDLAKPEVDTATKRSQAADAILAGKADDSIDGVLKAAKAAGYEATPPQISVSGLPASAQDVIDEAKAREFRAAEADKLEAQAKADEEAAKADAKKK